MIVTRNFIFIHLPKTGGTFVSSMLSKIHIENLKNKNFICKFFFRFINKYIYPDFKKIINTEKIQNIQETYGQHGGCNQIPRRFNTLPIYSTMRNPFDRYVSLYKYEWWNRNPIVGDTIIIKHFPSFPKLSFEDYFNLENGLFLKEQLPNIDNLEIGALSWQFIRFFFKNPYEVIKNPDLTTYSREKLLEMMYPVTFLFSENLNSDLYHLLKKNNYPENLITEIKFAEKINPRNSVRSKADTWVKYINSDMKKIILKKEKILFTIFPQYLNVE